VTGMENAASWEGRDSRYWREFLGVPTVQLFATTSSTNDKARAAAEHGAPQLTVIIADHQTQGRGRGGRSWHSAPGSSLLCSVIFRYYPNAHTAVGAAPVRIGHAVAGAIEKLAAVPTRVKWPNDIVVPGHGKIAGILCEAAARQDVAYLVAGIGINVRSPGDAFVSLGDISDRAVGRPELLAEIVARLRMFADAVTTPLADQELAAMRPRDILFGQAVEDEAGLSGRALGIARDGSLILQTASGLRPIHHATIRLAGSQAYPGAGE